MIEDIAPLIEAEASRRGVKAHPARYIEELDSVCATIVPWKFWLRVSAREWRENMKEGTLPQLVAARFDLAEKHAREHG